MKSLQYKNAKAIKVITTKLIQLYRSSGQPATALQDLLDTLTPAESKINASAPPAVYSLLSALHTQLSDGYSSEEVFQTGLLSTNGIHPANRLNNIDYLLPILINTADKDGYAHATLSIGSSYDSQNTNHWVSLFCCKKNGKYEVQYFNPISPQYNFAAQTIEKLTTDPLIDYTNHSNNLQKDSIHCAEFSILYLYLSSLRERLHASQNSQLDLTRQDELCIGLLNQNTFDYITEQLKTDSPLDVMRLLLSIYPDIPARIRKFNIDLHVKQVTKADLLKASDLILTPIKNILNRNQLFAKIIDSTLMTISFLSILTGIYIQIMPIFIAGSALMTYSGYHLSYQKNFTETKADITNAIEAAFTKPSVQNTHLFSIPFKASIL